MTRGTLKKRQLRISYTDFAREIKNDLPYLTHEYADGLYAHHLQGYYGESGSRVHRALQVLAAEGVIDLRKAPDRNFYVVVHGQPEPPMVELTPMQRQVARLVIETCKQRDTLLMQTDYTQLAGILKVSIGGLRSSMDRMDQLGYLLIVQPSQIGTIRSMILKIGPKLLKAYEAHHLDS